MGEEPCSGSKQADINVTGRHSAADRCPGLIYRRHRRNRLPQQHLLDAGRFVRDEEHLHPSLVLMCHLRLDWVGCQSSSVTSNGPYFIVCLKRRSGPGAKMISRLQWTTSAVYFSTTRHQDVCCQPRRNLWATFSETTIG